MQIDTSIRRIAASIACAAVLIAGHRACLRFAEGAEGSIVHIDDCTVKLIDRVVLASDRPGILDFVGPEEGAAVQIGQQVAGLRDEVAAAALAVAEKQAENDIEIRYARKAAEVAKAEYEKAELANKGLKGTFPEVEVLRLKLAAERSVLQIEQAKHQLEVNRLTRDQAAAELQTFRVEAPFDGVVTRVYKSKGEALRQGDPILELASTERVRVEGYVNIRDAWNVKPGARVHVQLDIPDVELDAERERLDGRIVFVDVAAQQVTLLVRVWAEVANPKNILRAGLNAKMTVFPGERATAASASAR
jgi:multidrug resistance efflux pump